MEKQTKYRSAKCECDGHKFDSKDEMRYYLMLKDRQSKDLLTFQLQPEVMLIPSFRLPNGTLQRAITYKPDFLVGYPDGAWEYIDVKGMSTQQGILRRKLFNWVQYMDGINIPLRWVASSYKFGDADGWIDYDELQKKRRQNKSL